MNSITQKGTRNIMFKPVVLFLKCDVPITVNPTFGNFDF